MTAVQTRCCIAGGGPAGVMLGYLLARRGVDVTVLEKHGDFFRDFRGDTVHPSTMTVLDELGILDDFLRIPHAELKTLGGRIGTDSITIANFDRVPSKTKFIALMPQWDFLNFLVAQGRKYPGFSLRMSTEAIDVIREGERVAGVRAVDAGGPIEIRADLVVGADGRTSTLRSALGIEPVDLGAPMDVLWFRIDRLPDDPTAALGYIGAGYFLVTINRDDYWQCGFVIAKGSIDAIKAEGLDSLRRKIVAVVPAFDGRVAQISSWDDVKMLSVAVNRLQRWYRPGILFIGDAAHAMSPIGGVGINLAIQDAIAAANILAPAFDTPGPIADATLARVQARREYPAKMTQALQVFIQNRAVRPMLESQTAPSRAPAPLHLLNMFPALQRLPALLVGIGFRAEHVEN